MPDPLSNKIKPTFSAIIITFNDVRYLEECIKSLLLCDEIIDFDMGSTDGSLEIAKKYATEVRHIRQVDVVEKVWSEVVHEAKHDWIILIDPDEIFPTAIFPELKKLIQTKPEITLISIPWKYYFLRKPLNSTHWGRDHFKARIFNRQHVEFTGLIFEGIKLKPGFSSYTFPYESGFILQHYWIDSIQQLFRKHWRYIRNAGEARYKKGERFTFRNQVNQSLKTLRKDLIDYKGLKDGCRGIFLSFFHAWFIFMCHFSLLIYQSFKVKKNPFD